jgi:hypothetical protein
MANVTHTQLNRLLSSLGLLLAVILLTGAGLAWWGHNFAAQQVHDQLSQEKISFPPADSSALDPKEFPGLQQYAGQPVDNGVKAKAYANEFIWVHMMKASGGKTYSEISTQAQANPKDTKLAGLKATLFQGDALRTSLLMAYAFSVMGMVAGYAAAALAIAAGLVLVIAAVGRARS